MLIQVLKSKLNLKVTAASNECEGSITLDPDLMEAARLYPYERVEVNGKNTLSRIVTYVIEGERGSGQCELNGGAANHFNEGEDIHVNCFAITVDKEMWLQGKEEFKKAIVVKTDENNKLL